MTDSTIIRSIVPALIVVDGTAEEADEIASDIADQFNRWRRNREAADPGATLRRLFLCEASPTTEWTEGEVPHTLEGLTCDSGSDRSATALIRSIVDTGATMVPRDPDTHYAALAKILTMATGWLQQRMALHPNASTEPARTTEPVQSAAELLFHAYGRAFANNVQPTWQDLEKAFQQAKAEHPGAFDPILSLYQAQKDASR